jgi:mono/diheme cytochrome c family protein
MNEWIRFAGAAALALTLAGTAHAQHRAGSCVLRQQQVHHVQQVVVPVRHHAQAVVAQVVNHHAVAQVVAHDYGHQYGQYQYYVGQGLRDDAIAHKAAEKLVARFEELIEQKIVQRLQANGPALPEGSPLASMQQIVARSCVSCHSAEADPDRMDLTDVTQLTEAQALSVMRQVYSGKMPKNATPLKDEEVAVFVDTLANWTK